jgi:hypothetical protein
MRILVNAYADSGINEAHFTVEGAGSRLRLPVAVDKRFTGTFDLPKSMEFDATEFSVAVESQGRHVVVLARHIPTHSELHLIGVNEDLFLGMVVHDRAQPHNLGPRCELRCSPNEQPVTGPGCISCEKGKLIFKICC